MKWKLKKEEKWNPFNDMKFQRGSLLYQAVSSMQIPLPKLRYSHELFREKVAVNAFMTLKQSSGLVRLLAFNIDSKLFSWKTMTLRALFFPADSRETEHSTISSFPNSQDF